MVEIPHRIYEWLARLHVLTAGSSSEEEAKSRIELLAPVAAAHFDVSSFSQASLNAVAAQCRFWPTSGELVEALREWRKSVKPSTLAITGPGRSDRIEGMDLHWLQYFRRREQEGFAPVNGVRSSREHVLSLIKQESLRAWSEITGIIPASLAPTEEEIAAVSRLIRPAPQGPSSQSAIQEPTQPPPPVPQYLEGEALRAFRARCGNPVPVPGPTPAADGWTAPEPIADSPPDRTRSVPTSTPAYRAPEPDPAPREVSRAFPPAMREPAGDDGLDELLPEGAF